VRLIVARCEVTYSGRLKAYLPEATRLLMIKADGTVLVWSDRDGYKVKPLNWMTPPTVVEESEGRIVVRKRPGKHEDRLEIELVEVLSDVSHELGEELRLVRREWPTDIGPVDLMCRDAEDGWVAVEIKRIAGIEAVEQLARYLERIRVDTARAVCRGVLAAQRFRPQAVMLAELRGIRCVEVDLAVLRGEREPELTLFV
jgi:RecB family endonuclease NucS